MSRKSPQFKEWLRTFRETGRAPGTGLFPPTPDMTDEQVHKVWKDSAWIRRKYGRRPSTSTGKERNNSGNGV